MSAADDYPVIACAAELLTGRSTPLRLELVEVLAEIDMLRTRSGAVARIEALRARACSAEQLVHTLYRALRVEATDVHRAAAQAAYHEWVGQERVA